MVISLQVILGGTCGFFLGTTCALAIVYFFFSKKENKEEKNITQTEESPLYGKIYNI